MKQKSLFITARTPPETVQSIQRRLKQRFLQDNCEIWGITQTQNDNSVARIMRRKDTFLTLVTEF